MFHVWTARSRFRFPQFWFYFFCMGATRSPHLLCNYSLAAASSAILRKGAAGSSARLAMPWVRPASSASRLPERLIEIQYAATDITTTSALHVTSNPE